MGASAPADATGLPLMSTRPAVGRASPTIILSAVVLPAPFGPRKPVTAPARTANDRSSTARTAPKRFVRPSTTIGAAIGETRVVFMQTGSAAILTRASARRPNFFFDLRRMTSRPDPRPRADE